MFLPASGAAPVSALRFEGLRHTREEVVRRELLHREGAPFDSALLRRERERLLDLDLFGAVETELRPGPSRSDSSPRPEAPPGDTLVYRFRELPPYIPYLALHKTDQDGLSLGPALASLNFLGTGTRLEAVSRFGGTSHFMLALSAPFLAGLPLEYDAVILVTRNYNDLDRFEERSERLRLEALFPRSSLRLLAGAELLAMRARRAADTARGITLNRDADLVPRLAAGLVLDTRERRYNPRRGLYQEARLTRSGGPLGGPADFWEALSDSRLFFPLSRRQTLHAAFLLQLRTGRMGREIGYYDDFHLGGANSLRGYRIDSRRGRDEAIGLLEHRYTFFERRALDFSVLHAHYGLQGVMGLEAAGTGTGFREISEGLLPAAYAGLHLLLPGLDRLRFEVGGSLPKIALRAELGVLEKTRTQRFQTR